MIPRPPTILAIDDTPANLMTLGAALQGEFELQIYLARAQTEVLGRSRLSLLKFEG